LEYTTDFTDWQDLHSDQGTGDRSDPVTLVTLCNRHLESLVQSDNGCDH